MKTTRISSITVAQADKFTATAKPRQSLFDGNVSGLHLQRLAKASVWRYRYTDATGARRTATVGPFPALKPEQAAARVLDWQQSGVDPLATKAAQRQRQMTEQAEANSRTLGAYLDNGYQEVMSSWKETNARQNTQMIRGAFADLLSVDMAALSGPAHIRPWQSQMASKGRAIATIRRNYGALMTLLNRAARDGVIATNPLQGWRLDAPTREQQTRTLTDPGARNRRPLTPDEVERLHRGLEAWSERLREQRRSSRQHGKPHLPDLDAVKYPHWFIPMCHLALHTGLRTGDLRSLTWEELSIPFARLRKQAEKSMHHVRTGGKPILIEQSLNPTITAIMKAWWEQCGKPQTGLVFASPVTGAELDDKAHKRPWRAVCAAAGLEGLTFYSLRHHYCSVLVAAGVPLLAVARLVGHRGTAMIERQYGHLLPEQARLAADVLEASVDVGGR